MSRISQLVALSAFVYALVIVVVVLLYLPPFVDWSVRLYRLLLAAYPASFRAEYGQEMIQLFRDTARAEYQRRGLWGLLIVWLRTLVDFSVSVVQQHREQPAAAVSSESVLLRDLLRQWRQFGAATLSVTTFSAWYVLHLLRLFFQRAVLVWATLTAIALGMWLGSFFHGIPLRKHGTPIVGGITRGMVWIKYAAKVGEPISEEQWQREARVWREENPTAIALLQSQLESRPKPWEVRLIGDIPGGVIVKYKPDWKTPALIQPYKQCHLWFPFFPVPALLLLGTVVAYRRRHAVHGAAMQSV
jgi:hypothetical protein